MYTFFTTFLRSFLSYRGIFLFGFRWSWSFLLQKMDHFVKAYLQMRIKILTSVWAAGVPPLLAPLLLPILYFLVTAQMTAVFVIKFYTDSKHKMYQVQFKIISIFEIWHALSVRENTSTMRKMRKKLSFIKFFKFDILN